MILAFTPNLWCVTMKSASTRSAVRPCSPVITWSGRRAVCRRSCPSPGRAWWVALPSRFRGKGAFTNSAPPFCNAYAPLPPPPVRRSSWMRSSRAWGARVNSLHPALRGWWATTICSPKRWAVAWPNRRRFWCGVIITLKSLAISTPRPLPKMTFRRPSAWPRLTCCNGTIGHCSPSPGARVINC